MAMPPPLMAAAGSRSGRNPPLEEADGARIVSLVDECLMICQVCAHLRFPPLTRRRSQR